MLCEGERCCVCARTEAGPEEDFGDHCVGAGGRVAPARCVQSGFGWVVVLLRWWYEVFG
jgi:hypothetical protein